MPLSHHRSYDLLRYSLGVVFVWFGILKLFNVSPVIDLIQQVTPSFLPTSPLLIFLIAAAEILLGISFFMKRLYRLGSIATLGYLVVVTVLTLIGKGFNPFFPVLSFEGEFVVKNLVLMAGCLVLFTLEVDDGAKTEGKKDGSEK